MISQAFKQAVADKNLLRVRIMLKDSLLIDPTFWQFNELLTYARTHLPDLLVPYDTGVLENNPQNWNEAVMNLELVQLVDNFSEIRIDHLKNLVPAVRKMNIQPNAQTFQNTFHRTSSAPYADAQADAKARQIELFRKIYMEYQKIEHEISGVRKDTRSKIANIDKTENRRRAQNIDKIEIAAKAIYDAIQDYKNNK